MTETRVALITGAGSGIGKATALAFLRDGFRVVLAGRHLDKLAAVASARRARMRQSMTFRADVTNPAEVRTLFDATREKFGRLDVLFNNAGIERAIPAARGHALREMARGHRHQSHRRVPVHAAGVPADEGSDAARRPHHQQRLDLRAHAAREFRALHGVEARDHGTDEVDVARWPQVRHRLRPDRHRQCADRARQPPAAGRSR